MEATHKANTMDSQQRKKLTLNNEKQTLRRLSQKLSNDFETSSLFNRLLKLLLINAITAD